MADLIDRQENGSLRIAAIENLSIRCKNCGHHIAERPFEVYCNIMCKWVNEKCYCTMLELGHTGYECEKEIGND